MTRQADAVVALCEKHGELDPEILIIRLCRELVAECSTESGPSPLNVLGSVRGVRLCRAEPLHPQLACSALLVPKNGGFEVIVNIEEPEERQRFSFAHEIVHTFFREVEPNVLTPSQKEERLCDLGAAELTMPLRRFSAEMQGQVLCLDLFDQLSEEFKVSLQAVGRRAVGITEEVACFFVASLARTRHQDMKDIGDPALRLVGWTASQSWPDKLVYKNKSITDNCIIAESFSNLDARTGRGNLGVALNTSVYDIETRSFEYQRGAIVNHREVVALAKAS
jgi:Zn-dependent peptidase ImmA (M78 family)